MSQLHYPSDIVEKIKDCSVLLDTNILIGFLAGSEQYKELQDLLIKANVSLGTIDLCRHEFFKNTAKKDYYVAKQKILKALDVKVIECSTMTNDFDNLISLLGGKSAKPEITDLILGATLLKYPNPARPFFLLTENIKDFEAKFFKREIIVNMENNDGMKSIAFLSLDKSNIDFKKLGFK